MAVSRANWRPPQAPTRTEQGRVPGVMGGSLLLQQPRYRQQLSEITAFIERPPPLAVEIGFDHGINLLANARLFEDWIWLGVELRQRRVAAVAPNAPPNCLPTRLDGRALLAMLMPQGRIHRLELMFPTPTANRRHLLLTEHFAADVQRAMAPGGIVHLMTDVPGIAQLFDRLFANWRPCAAPPRAADLSRRERICKRDGVVVHERSLKASDD